MDNLNEFKKFVKLNPQFASYVTDGSMTWQKFYELYDMYGSESTIWNEYKKDNKKSPTINEIISMAKKIDINKLQDGVSSLSKAVGLFTDIFASKQSNNTQSTYEPRAIYHRFED